MYNNGSACYANAVIQLLFRLDEFNDKILAMDDAELKRTDMTKDNKSNLLTYKKLLTLRDEAKIQNKKIDQDKTNNILRKELNHEGQEDSAFFLNILFGSILDNKPEIINHLYFTSNQVEKINCEDRTSTEKDSTSKEYILNLVHHGNNIQNLINEYFTLQIQKVEDTKCTSKKPNDEIITAIEKFKSHYDKNTIFIIEENRLNKGRYIKEELQIGVKDFFEEGFALLNIYGFMSEILKRKKFDTNDKRFEILYDAMSSSKLDSASHIKTDKFLLFHKALRKETKYNITIPNEQKYMLISVNHNNSKNLELNDEVTFPQIDKEVRFKLIGFTAYKGKISEGRTSGHYISYILKDGFMFRLDDMKSDKYGIPVQKDDYKTYESGYNPNILAYERI